MMSHLETHEDIDPLNPDELRRITAPARSHSLDSDPDRDAYLALGQSVDAATAHFDWRRLAAKLEAEIATDLARPRPQTYKSPRPSFVGMAIVSAALLLLALSLGVFSGLPSEGRPQLAGNDRLHPPPERIERGLDSWERTSGVVNADWQDEIDLKLAATRRALRQGRDPWVNDEPVLSEVIAQIGDLKAGLVFDPF